MAKMGRPRIDNPRSNMFSIRFNDEEVKKINKDAKELNITVAELIRLRALQQLKE